MSRRISPNPPKRPKMSRRIYSQSSQRPQALPLYLSQILQTTNDARRICPKHPKPPLLPRRIYTQSSQRPQALPLYLSQIPQTTNDARRIYPKHPKPPLPPRRIFPNFPLTLNAPSTACDARPRIAKMTKPRRKREGGPNFPLTLNAPSTTCDDRARIAPTATNARGRPQFPLDPKRSVDDLRRSRSNRQNRDECAGTTPISPCP